VATHQTVISDGKLSNEREQKQCVTGEREICRYKGISLVGNLSEAKNGDQGDGIDPEWTSSL
jgi:hypothetical protein